MTILYRADFHFDWELNNVFKIRVLKKNAVYILTVNKQKNEVLPTYFLV